MTDARRLARVLTLAEQAREIAHLTTILTDVTADANLSHRQITRLEEEIERLREALSNIMDLSAGWDTEGSLGPRSPLSWESVGRVAMDYARAALRTTPEVGG